MVKPCSCPKVRIVDTQIGTYNDLCTYGWNCQQGYGGMQKIHRYMGRYGHHIWDFHMTLTCKLKFQPPVYLIGKATDYFHEFMAAFTRKYHLIFFWSAGVGDNGYIHFHVLLQGQKPSIKWIKKQWRAITGRRWRVHLTGARPSSLYYLLANNAAKIPDIYNDSRFIMADIYAMKDLHFRRVGPSYKLPKRFPPSRSQPGRFQRQAIIYGDDKHKLTTDLL